MRAGAPSFFIVLLVSCCSSSPADSGGAYTPFPIPSSINAGNFTAYPLTLQPYEFKIIKISGYGEPIDTNPGWWKDAAVYQVFVRSFKDSDGDGMGDLKGLASCLDYVSNLGFDAIWTLPVFSSPSIHGYDTSDYYTIEPDYGSAADFSAYVSACQARGIKVVLDMVINHTSSDNQWFADSQSGASHQDWYVWTNVQPSGWAQPWTTTGQVWYYSSTKGMYYYAAFSGGMPDLNFNSAGVRAEVTNIARYWADRGANGYRLDAVRYLVETGPAEGQRDTPATLARLKDYEAALKSFNPGLMTVGEAWTGNDTVSLYYQNGLGLDSAFGFDWNNLVLRCVKNDSPVYIDRFINSPPSAPWSFFSPFLDNHDDCLGNNYRAMDYLGGSYDLARLAAGMLMTFPGTPYLYYGTEIGMKKGPQNSDTGKRTPMQWDETPGAGFTAGAPWTAPGQNADPCNVRYQLSNTNSLFYAYKNLALIRKTFEGLRRGVIRTVSCSDYFTLAYLRPGTNDTVLAAFNFGPGRKDVTLNFTGSGLSAGTGYPTLEVLSSLTNLTRF